MTIFLRMLADKDKAASMLAACCSLRTSLADERVFEVDPKSFTNVPGAPFSYWVSEGIRNSFNRLPAFDGPKRIARITNPAGDDTRFVRSWWEVDINANVSRYRWANFSKGGAYSNFYYDVHLLVCWDDSRKSYHGFLGTEHRPLEKPACVEHFFRPGLTWPSRTNGLSFRVMPAGCVFTCKGPAAFVAEDDTNYLLALLSIANSKAFGLLVSMQLARSELAQSFEVGLIQNTPIPDLSPEQEDALAAMSCRAWGLKRALDTVEETSHAFLVPAALRSRLGEYDPPTTEVELTRIQAQIDDIAFDLYGFSDADRAAAQAGTAGGAEAEGGDAEEDDGDDATAAPIDLTGGLLSWAVGVAFGRFDWRLATGEREVPPEPKPFDPLPAKSPGMLPDGAEPFHAHAGILVDDPGHPHDLARLVEEVLERVETPVPADVRRWLQRDFFAFHLQRYSKSRRKAPIYWPLATASGAYTLWLYYPSLSSQTLYTAINDFVEPKLRQVGQEATALRGKTGRSRDEDKALEALQNLELELIDLRDTLLQIAATWRPNHDDGVQITAAPLWPLFRHKPWQKVLKDTWAKLEKGDYDWSHLAMSYWPDRVRDKCKTDKSLAIAHGLEDLYVEPATAPKKTRGKKKTGGEE